MPTGTMPTETIAEQAATSIADNNGTADFLKTIT